MAIKIHKHHLSCMKPLYGLTHCLLGTTAQPNFKVSYVDVLFATNLPFFDVMTLEPIEKILL